MENLNLSGDSFDFQYFLNKQMIRVLENYIDREYVHNPKYLIKQSILNSGTIHDDIYAGLYNQYSIIRGEEIIAELVDKKVMKIIKRLYV
jgi:hypothetical protein